MILSYRELRKRDVVNIADGRSFGKITDLQIEFPRGTLKGITVCDRRRGGFFGLWCKNEIFISEKNVIRIGGDVILVNIKNCDALNAASVDVNEKSADKNSVPSCPPKPPCPPSPCPPVLPFGGDICGTREEVGTDFEDY